MMMLFLLLAADWSALESYDIDSVMFRPVTFFSDVNDDGVTDIFIRGKNVVWFRDGTWEAGRIEKIEHYDAPGRPRPASDGSRWWLKTWRDTLEFEHHGDDWVLTGDLARYSDIRPDRRPLPMGGMSLVPTMQGYNLVEGDCVHQELQVPPVAVLKPGSLELTWADLLEEDLNGDGVMDLMSAPLHDAQFGHLRIWSGIKDETSGQWKQKVAKMQFPSNMRVVKHQLGDLDGDGIRDLVVMTRSNKDLSIFEEMSFVIYLGTEVGLWDETPIQTLSTKQNLWQTGPIEVDNRGITFYYYKGLLRSHFKMDLFVWDKAGFIKPSPKSRKWTLKKADRSVINMAHDFNRDGLKDLLLRDKNGTYVHFRKKGSNFAYDKAPNERWSVGSSDSGADISVAFDSDGSASVSNNVIDGMEGYIRRQGEAFIQHLGEERPRLWSMKRQPNMEWKLTQLKYE